VGVRAPSLYKRVSDRDGLIRLAAEANMVELTLRLNAAENATDLANSFRAFAHERPAAFQLIMAPGPGSPVARPEFGAAASEAVLQLAESLVGRQHSLDAARTLTAWASGFISMELNGGFNLGGAVEQAWQFGLGSILNALAIPQTGNR